jgi:hypothetical protein
MGVEDEFVVTSTDSWRVTEEKYLPLRFANIKIVPKKGRAFSLMLYLKCDTPGKNTNAESQTWRSTPLGKSLNGLPPP